MKAQVVVLSEFYEYLTDTLRILLSKDAENGRSRPVLVPSDDSAAALPLGATSPLPSKNCSIVGFQ
jgi:hypothetical protein